MCPRADGLRSDEPKVNQPWERPRLGESWGVPGQPRAGPETAPPHDWGNPAKQEEVIPGWRGRVGRGGVAVMWEPRPGTSFRSLTLTHTLKSPRGPHAWRDPALGGSNGEAVCRPPLSGEPHFPSRQVTRFILYFHLVSFIS